MKTLTLTNKELILAYSILLLCSDNRILHLTLSSIEMNRKAQSVYKLIV